MKILNEQFYYMHNQHDANFDLSEIDMVLLNPADIQTVDIETMEVVAQETVYICICVLKDGVFAATRPLESEKLAAKICEILQKKLRRMYGD
jgi:hypothetical protein